MAKWWILGSLVVLCGLFLAIGTSNRVPSTAPLVAAAEGADRVVVRGFADFGNKPPAPSFEIEGREAVRSLLDQIELVPPAVPPGGGRICFRCGGGGDFHLQFFRGEKLLVLIGYHHNQSIRWRNGPWDTDVYLTTASRKAIPSWFEHHGFPAMKECYEEKKLLVGS